MAEGIVIRVGRVGVAEAVELAEGSDLLQLVATLLVKIFFKLRLVHRNSFSLMLRTSQYSEACLKDLIEREVCATLGACVV